MKEKENELRIVDPSFGSRVLDLIMDINYLRRRQLGGSTHPEIFFQIKHIFHILESIGSARIEGNHTTIAEYVEREIEDSENEDEAITEIKNNEAALSFIEEVIETTPINRAFVCELHKLVVKDLHREGSQTPGQYRNTNIVINHSKHTPPDFLRVNELMDELIAFINKPDPEKYDLIKVAIAHHRFTWIHPFDNGNGRTVRLLTYAMMIKMGFKVDNGRILNPTAVFCSDRDAYYDALQRADEGTDEGILAWVEYVLSGLNDEISKIDNLLEFDFVKSKILLPALKGLKERKIITTEELKILNKAAEKQEFKTSDLNEIFPDQNSVYLSRAVKRLRDLKFLKPIEENSRTYVLSFLKNYLMREIMICLDREGFLPMKNEV
ncbi:Fic family protein [Spirochaeta isovalerica]|uniref:Fic family protein n=1 Tax=Spirochaeta isovalerica TaxID=150 RepID=A0A841R6T0_9SPIO|nr:Fic family protein [Spirochaeta isovalerica]MBB6478478.1 Fic family protein [Spirochaeta isovalerica]